MQPIIVPRPEHSISRQNIDRDALQVLYRLHRSGHKGYLVGGGVRDLMLGIRPKDFDIATDARPNRLKKLFHNCRIIGRRFRLAHLRYGPHKIIEVATFRSSGESDAIVRDGELIRRDNVYGSPGEDARRRDITINALFYDISDFSVIDYVGGVADLKAGIIRTIADPVRSFREDPVRLLRVLRHGTRLGFRLARKTEDALCSERMEILKANPTRVLEELYRDLSHGKARQFFEALHRYRFLEILAPALVDAIDGVDEDEEGSELFLEGLDRLDALVQQSSDVTHAVALAVFFAPLILPVARELEQNGSHHNGPPWEPFVEVLRPVLQNLKIYRRDEDRLWHALGAWPKIARAVRRGGRIPTVLGRRHYFPDAAEIFALLCPDTPGVEEFLDQARQLPPPTEQTPARRRSRPRGGRRKSSRGPAEEGEAPARSEGGGDSRRRRRRRGGRRRRSRAGGKAEPGS